MGIIYAALSAMDNGVIYNIIQYNIFIIFVNLNIRRFSNPVSASYTEYDIDEEKSGYEYGTGYLNKILNRAKFSPY